MRVAMIALLALPAIAGFATPAFACPLGSGSTGPVSQLPCTVLKLACGGTTPSTGPTSPTTPGDKPGTTPTAGATTINNITNNTTTNNTTNNVTNNFFDGKPGEETKDAKATTATTPFTFPATAGGGGGGAGGGLGGGSFSSGSSSVAGMPVNPSADLGFQQLASSGSGASSAGGGVFPSSPVITSIPSSGGSTSGTSIVMADADTSSAGVITPGVSLASLPAPKDEESYTIAMASPSTAAAMSPSAPSSGFGLEGPGATGAPVKAGVGGTTLLAGLIGVGVLGAGWAWRALVV